MESPVKRQALIFGLLGCLGGEAGADASYAHTPYTAPKVIFDIYLDDPQKMGSALNWLRALLQPLSEPPHEYDPETIKVMLHGTEIVTVARKNEEKYAPTVERMRYYANLGIEFKVCSLAAEEYGYSAADLQTFVQLIPSAVTELAYWQNRGYAVIAPMILEKKYAIEQIR
jgi:intracellular sulfur oxidation DsrE/DsrF family protein